MNTLFQRDSGCSGPTIIALIQELTPGGRFPAVQHLPPGGRAGGWLIARANCGIPCTTDIAGWRAADRCLNLRGFVLLFYIRPCVRKGRHVVLRPQELVPIFWRPRRSSSASA